MDGLLIKVNQVFTKLIGYEKNEDLEFQSMIQDFIHPQDVKIHDLLLLKMLSSNIDTKKSEMGFVNINCKSTPLLTEMCCIRNEMRLPQWIVM
jgi:hypothetical protein